MPCAFGHESYNPLCDACDSHKCDVSTGWGGFTDHFAKKHFDTNEDQIEYYRKEREMGKTGIRDNWEDD